MSLQTSSPEYSKAHTYCPKCSSLDIESTTMGIGGTVDTNHAYCHKCKWVGICSRFST